MAVNRVSIGASERQPVPWATAVRPAAPQQLLEVSVILRRRTPLPPLDPQGRPPGGFLSREEFAARHGADSADIAAVEDLASAYGLTVTEVSQARRTVRLTGSVAAMSDAFGVTLHEFEHGGGSYRGRTGAIEVPAALDGVVLAVLGLDDRPQARAQFRLHQPAGPQVAEVSYTPPEVARLYTFPTNVDGTGECIAIIELGGGYRTTDLATYFQSLGITQPRVVSVSVDGATNAPGSPNGPDGEVMLDIEVAGSVAPGGEIVVYFAPNNTDKGFIDAVSTAVHDAHHRPSVVSISWGGAESTWTGQALDAFDQVFQEAGAMGVTVCAASGDNGSSDGVPDGASHVDFPAASPHVLGCGGTSLLALGGAISSEEVWNDGPGGGAGGGGVSAYFPLPAWQSDAHVPTLPGASGPGRGVPDVAGDADPATGYQVRVDGMDTVIAGTSAVAPLWAGLIALCNQQLGRSVGFINPIIYRMQGGFHDITTGNDGAWTAGPGWDPATGLGSPDGTALAAGL